MSHPAFSCLSCSSCQEAPDSGLLALRRLQPPMLRLPDQAGKEHFDRMDKIGCVMRGGLPLGFPVASPLKGASLHPQNAARRPRSRNVAQTTGRHKTKRGSSASILRRARARSPCPWTPLHRRHLTPASSPTYSGHVAQRRGLYCGLSCRQRTDARGRV